MRKAVGTSHVLGIFEELFGIEIADLSPDFTIVLGGIERVDGTNAADSVLQIRPKRLNAVANWRDNTHTGDDYSALGHDDIA
jgi:DNA mismatch repair protein MutH